MIDTVSLNTAQAVVVTGATFRQLDYWTTQGWLSPGRAERRPEGWKQDGNDFLWSERELLKAGGSRWRSDPAACPAPLRDAAGR